MKARITHNNEIIDIEKDGATEKEILRSCEEIIRRYYKNHKNIINIKGEKIEYDIKIFQKPKTKRIELKIKEL